MAPLTTGAPPAAAHVIHAQAAANAQHQKGAQHAAPKKSTAPRLSPRHTTSVAKKATRTSKPYRVRSGDNLTTIAARHHVSLAALIKHNRISTPNRVLSGSTLQIPHRTTAPTKAAAKKPAKKATSKKSPAHKTASRGDATRSALAKRAVPSRTQTKAIIEKTARRYGVNPHLALGISWQESGWNQRVVSSASAVGVMQVMPQSGEWASAMVGHDLDLLDTHDNITAGVVILRYLTSNATSLNQAIGGYYQGLGAMQQHGAYDETKQYIRNVRALMERL
ncbi:lytic transglycosylase [Flexivirga sp. B27]